MNTENDELKFKGGNPGAVQYGNFINYYQFHPPEERIELLPKNIWPSQKGTCTALDIGCNAGDLTVSLSQFIEDYVNPDFSILAVDIDPTLIERAKLLKVDNIFFFCLDIMDEIKREQVIGGYLAEGKINKFSIVFCFSTTMWIHLNYGDEGLCSFLKYISSISETIVIEPQPWKCYKTALKRMKQKDYTFPHFSSLKMRQTVENDIENIIINDCGLEKLMESKRTGWDRKLLIFKQKTQVHPE